MSEKFQKRNTKGMNPRETRNSLPAEFADSIDSSCDSSTRAALEKGRITFESNCDKLINTVVVLIAPCTCAIVWHYPFRCYAPFDVVVERKH